MLDLSREKKIGKIGKNVFGPEEYGEIGSTPRTRGVER
jgi:hypothetical protein